MESLKSISLVHFSPFVHGITTVLLKNYSDSESGCWEDEVNFHLLLVASSSFLWKPECATTYMLRHFTLAQFMFLHPMKADLRHQLKCLYAMDLRGLTLNAVRCLTMIFFTFCRDYLSFVSHYSPFIYVGNTICRKRDLSIVQDWALLHIFPLLILSWGFSPV